MNASSAHELPPPRAASRPVSAEAAHYRRSAQLTDAMYGSGADHQHRLADDNRDDDDDDDYAPRRQRQRRSSSSSRKRARQQRPQRQSASSSCSSALYDSVSDSLHRLHAQHQNTERIELDEECSAAIVLSPPFSLSPLPPPRSAAALPLPALPLKSAFARLAAAPSVYRDEPVFKRKRRGRKLQGQEAELRLIRVRGGAALSVRDDVIDSDREEQQGEWEQQQEEARKGCDEDDIAATALSCRTAQAAASGGSSDWSLYGSGARGQRSPELGDDDSDSVDIGCSPLDSQLPTEPQSIDFTLPSPSSSLPGVDGDDGKERVRQWHEAVEDRRVQQARQRAAVQLRIDNYRSVSTRAHTRAAAPQAQQLALPLALLQGYTQADDDVEEAEAGETVDDERSARSSAESECEQRGRMSDLIACQRYANPEVQLSSLCKLPLIPALLATP